MKQKLTNILTDPITVALTTGTAIAHALGFGPVVAAVGVIWANISTVFTFFSLAGFTLAPAFAWLPSGPLSAAALFAGSLYLVKLGGRIWDRTDSKL